MTEIVDRTVKAGGPALLFERPKGSDHPLLVNQFGTERRMCLAFGVERLDDVAAKLADVLEMQPPEGLAEKLRGLQKLKSIADSRPKLVRQRRLPGDRPAGRRGRSRPCCRSRRAGPATPAPFITLPAVITRDPRTGGRNVGMYRMQVLGPRSTAMHWQIHKDGRADYLVHATAAWRSRSRSGSIRSPRTRASAPLPKHIDELMFAGFLRGEPVEVVKGVTVDLEVPANAEIVLEGYVEQGELADEGPFGDHTGFYTPPERFPVFHVTAMTMRRDAIYPSIVVGKPPQEDAWLGKATERIFLPAIRADGAGDRRLRPAGRGRLPQLRDRLDPQGVPRARAQGDARDLGSRDAQPDEGGRRRRRARRRPRLRAGRVLRRRERRPGARRRAHGRARSTTSTTHRRSSSSAASSGSTRPRRGPRRAPASGRAEIEMSAEVRELVDRRWAEYGIVDGSSGMSVRECVRVRDGCHDELP